jgi:ketosteroid isomerase-like protein
MEVTERLRQVYARWAEGDFRDTSIFASDLVYERAGTEGIGITGRWRGLDAISATVRDWLDAWEDYRIVPEGFPQLDDGRIVVDVRRSGRMRDSDVRLDRPGADVWTFDGDQAVEVVSYWDREDAYRAVRLSP